MDSVFPGENLTSVIITPLQAYYSFGNGSLYFCGDYFVPNFMEANLTPRAFTPLGSDDFVTAVKYQNKVLVIATLYNVFKVNFTDSSFQQMINNKIIYSDLIAG